MKYVILLFLFTSCTAMKLQQSTPQASIHDIYVLEQVAGQNVQGKTQKQSTLEINLTDMRMMGNDGCNDFGGKITKHSTDKMELIFGDINATEMYCDELSNKVGQSFYEVKKYKREGVLLMLMSESNEELLRYKKVD